MSSLSKPIRDSLHRSISHSGGFNRLPNELLLQISKFFGRACDLYALRRVNKRLAVLLETFLSDILLRAYQPPATRYHLFAVGSCNAESLVGHLIRLGIDLNAVECESCPVLHFAVAHSQISMVSALLHHGARIHVADSFGDNAVHAAIQATCRNSGPLKIPQELDLAILGMLLDNGGLQTMNDVSSLNSRSGLSWLNLAVRSCPRNNMAIVRPFLVRDLSLDGPGKEDNRTPLHMAVCHNQVDLATTLLDLGADHRTIDSRGKSPFATACNRPNCELVDLLLRRDATLFDEVVGEHGETAELCMQRSVERWSTSGGRYIGAQNQYYEVEMGRRQKVVEKLRKLGEARRNSVISDSNLQIYYNSL